MNGLKTVAKTDKSNARDLLVQACGSADIPTVAVLPTVKNLVGTVKRHQNEFNGYVNPKLLADLAREPVSVTAADGQSFLLIKQWISMKGWSFLVLDIISTC